MRTGRGATTFGFSFDMVGGNNQVFIFIYNLDDPYNPSISLLYFWYTSLRRTFNVGVSVLSSTLNGSRLR